MRNMVEKKIYVFYNVLAEIKNGLARIVIDEPIGQSSWNEFFDQMNKSNFKSKVDEFKKLIETRGSGIVELASKTSPTRLGGGFIQREGVKVVLIKRDESAPRRPAMFDIPAGIFEDTWEDPIQMMFAESAEVLRKQGDTLYYPSIRHYDDVILSELDKIRKLFAEKRIRIAKIDKVKADLKPLPGSPIKEILYLDKKIEGLDITFEDESCSIELVGQLFLEYGEYEYADGEMVKASTLLNREIHIVNKDNLEDEVWQSFRKIRSASFDEELKKSNGLTSKAEFIYGIWR